MPQAKDSGIQVSRSTKETAIDLILDFDKPAELSFSFGLPFFEHMLHAMAFHGGFGLKIKAKGDLEVDPHHLVEDLGLVLGQALSQYLDQIGAVDRYGSSIIPMDDALSEAVIDVCRRPYLVYQAQLPQTHAGTFDLSLLREFFLALANTARINLHLNCRYGVNSHHMVESLFKALGRAIKQAYLPRLDDKKGTASMSTKGAI